jgi:hypothetical protein
VLLLSALSLLLCNFSTLLLLLLFCHYSAAAAAQAWHAGCLPLSGDKWTMQKFKELPAEFRKQISYPWLRPPHSHTLSHSREERDL